MANRKMPENMLYIVGNNIYHLSLYENNVNKTLRNVFLNSFSIFNPTI